MLQCSPENSLASAEDYAKCRAAIRAGSRSFFAASLLLPAAVRRPAYGLYAFCRLSDDAIDIGDGSIAAIQHLRDRLARAYDGHPLPLSTDRAMADLVKRFAIPRAIPEALLEGLEWDSQNRRYETLDDLFDYAARVAGTVGVMMTLIMGVRTTAALARACDLGVAMQLTNIARDVGEDARAGRLYLPLRWLREAGLDPESLLAVPAASPRLQGVVSKLLREADLLYARARQGIGHLPLGCRAAILTAALLYADIGRETERLSLEAFENRAHISGGRKGQLLARGLVGAPWLKAGPPGAALAAVEFLIDAVTVSPSTPSMPSGVRAAPWDILPQILRVLAIFERLERVDQFGD